MEPTSLNKPGMQPHDTMTHAPHGCRLSNASKDLLFSLYTCFSLSAGQCPVEGSPGGQPDTQY